MMTDVLMEEMSRISAEQKVKKEYDGPELILDESQFSVFASNEQPEMKFSEMPFISDCIVKSAVDYDGQDKAILKEKKRALDLPDIIDEAHPESAFMAEGPFNTGVVENQNEQHRKMLEVVQRQPSGFHYNKFAELIPQLTSMAANFEDKGDFEAMKKVDMVLGSIVKETSRFLDNTSAALNRKANIPKDIPASVLVPGVTPASFPPIPADKALTKRPEMGLTKTPKVPGNTPPFMSSTPPLLPPASIPASGPQAMTNKPVSPMQPSTPPIKDVGRGPGKPVTRPALPAPPISQLPVKAVKPGLGMFARLSRVLKGKGGKAAIILASIGAASYLIEELMNKDSLIQSDVGTVVSGSSSPEIAAKARELSGATQSAKDALNSDKPEEALTYLSLGEDFASDLNQMASAESATVKEAAGRIDASFKDVAGKANSFINKGLTSSGESLKDDRNRVMGVQNFIREHVDSSHPITGFMDPRTKKSIHDFVDSMRKDLGIAPKLLTVKNLIEYADSDKMERLWDIWQRPHMYVKK